MRPYVCVCILRACVRLCAARCECVSLVFFFRLFFFALLADRRHPSLSCARRRYLTLSPPSKTLPERSSIVCSTIPQKKRRYVAPRTTSNAVTLIIPDRDSSSLSLSSPSPPLKRNCNAEHGRASSTFCDVTALVTSTSSSLIPTTTTTTTLITTTTANTATTATEMETQDTSMTNLIINYLPQSMTDKKLHQMFTQIGQIEACRVMKDVKVSTLFLLLVCLFCMFPLFMTARLALVSYKKV